MPPGWENKREIEEDDAEDDEEEREIEEDEAEDQKDELLRKTEEGIILFRIGKYHLYSTYKPNKKEKLIRRKQITPQLQKMPNIWSWLNSLTNKTKISSNPKKSSCRRIEITLKRNWKK